MKSIPLAGFAFVLLGCASYPQPTDHLAASMASVRGAQEAGAEQEPQAALHLKLAQDQLGQAQTMMKNGDNEQADGMAIRAYNDAELALAIARANAAKQREEAFAQNAKSDDHTSGGSQPNPTTAQ